MEGLTAAVTKLELQLPVRKHRCWEVFSICRRPSFIVSDACLLQALICFQLLGLLDSIFIKVSSVTQPLVQWSSFNGSVALPLSLCLSVPLSVCLSHAAAVVFTALTNGVAQFGCPSHRPTTCPFLVLQPCSFTVCSFLLLLYVHGYVCIDSLVWYAHFFVLKYDHWHCLSRHDGCWPRWYCGGEIYFSLKWKRSSFISLCDPGRQGKNDDLLVSCRSLQLLGLKRRQVDRRELGY